MKTKFKIPFLTIGFGSLVFLGFAGTISGSLAWWAYSTRVSVSYQGTSVASSEQIQIGIKTGNSDMPSLETLGMTHGTINGQHYYWCDAGAGLPAGIVGHYLQTKGTYAVSELEPVTSGSYTVGDTFRLKNPLVSGNRYNDTDADTNKYVYLPLAFRILRYNASNERTYATRENIWLSDTEVKASSVNDGNVYKAIRMYSVGQMVDEDRNLVDSIHLINPSNRDDDSGQTAVCGLLDISGSGYYDTYERNGKSYNIVYGESNLTETQLLAIETQTSNTDSGIIDFNNTGMGTSERSTFTSRFYRNTYYPLNQAAIEPKYQVFDTLKRVRPDDDNGALSNGAPLCATNDDGVADLALTIWLEGWDHNVIDKENHHSFSLGLQFQISRL